MEDYMEIIYTSEKPAAKELLDFYNQMGWNDFLGLDLVGMECMIKGSYYMISAYSNKKLIGNARLISDGITNAYICGLGVAEAYRRHGIAAHMFQALKEKIDTDGLHGQFFCEESLKEYYQKRGAAQFAIGMRI